MVYCVVTAQVHVSVTDDYDCALVLVTVYVVGGREHRYHRGKPVVPVLQQHLNTHHVIII